MKKKLDTACLSLILAFTNGPYWQNESKESQEDFFNKLRLEYDNVDDYKTYVPKVNISEVDIKTE
jgi:hypothetical protein